LLQLPDKAMWLLATLVTLDESESSGEDQNG